MAARRDSPPPYELMTRYPPTGPPADEHGTPTPPPTDDRKRLWTDLWTRWRDPVIFRLPRGYILALAAVLLGLIVLAFWTGQSIGYRRGFKDNQNSAIASTPPAGLGFVGPGQVQSALGGRIRLLTEPSVASDPRQAGLNYLVLAHLAQQEAQHLLAFLWDNGVDAAAFRAHNTRLYQVVALRGFTDDQLDTAAADYTQHLAALGRLWSQDYQGADFSKNGIYRNKYQPQPVAIMMIRGTAP